ncbi:MAG: YidC/Oxa1 family membrane protein insertase [Actinobacteria bacterium]|nr:YidC/Oxa1 family membrane protein insertase [Actinomycetota bacterium]
MIALGLFEGPAWLLAKFYDFTHNYILAISLIALVVMLITAPLQLKATKGMLEMQRLQPELRKLQQEHRGDRQKLNEEMMKLYQQHKVNPLASCFPLLLQFPVFIIMFRVLHGLTYEVVCGTPNLSPGAAELCIRDGVQLADGTKVFYPKFIDASTELYQSLAGKSEMVAWGLDLAKRPFEVIGESFGKGLIYALLVVALGALYFVQQRMVAARASVSPTMSEMQQKIMQYLPVVFAVFLVFYLTGLVIYYMAQAIFRIGLQYYITKRFYAGEQSLGRQAQAAGERAREMSKADGGGSGLFAQAKRDLASAKDTQGKPAAKGAAAAPGTSKRVTPPKNKPTASGRVTRPPSSGKAPKPTPPTPPAPKKKS